MNKDRDEILNVLPKKKSTDMTPIPGRTSGTVYDFNCGFNTCRTDSAEFLAKRVATVEELVNCLKTFLFIDKENKPNSWLKLSNNECRIVAQALKSEYVILRREKYDK